MKDYSVMRRWDEEVGIWLYMVVYGTDTIVDIVAKGCFSDPEKGDIWADRLIKEKKLQ